MQYCCLCPVSFFSSSFFLLICIFLKVPINGKLPICPMEEMWRVGRSLCLIKILTSPRGSPVCWLACQLTYNIPCLMWWLMIHRGPKACSAASQDLFPYQIILCICPLVVCLQVSFSDLHFHCSPSLMNP